MELDSIDFTKKTGNEKLVGCGKERNLLDFWQWAYSDLVGNTERGFLVEYLVALACNIDNKVRISWDAYDLILENGIKIEVKSSGYLQTWKQKDYSKPLFRISKTFAWNYKENVFEKEKKRQADVYVFALLAHKDQKTINPLDTTQWDFYVVNARLIDAKVGDAKQINLGKLIKLNAIKSNFVELMRNILLAKSNTEW